MTKLLVYKWLPLPPDHYRAVITWDKELFISDLLHMTRIAKIGESMCLFYDNICFGGATW